MVYSTHLTSMQLVFFTANQTLHWRPPLLLSASVLYKQTEGKEKSQILAEWSKSKVRASNNLWFTLHLNLESQTTHFCSCDSTLKHLSLWTSSLLYVTLWLSSQPLTEINISPVGTRVGVRHLNLDLTLSKNVSGNCTPPTSTQHSKLHTHTHTHTARTQAKLFWAIQHLTVGL